MESTFINYDLRTWKFREVISRTLSVDNLEKIHEHIMYDKFDRVHDQSTIWHKKYYDGNKDFLNMYVDFVKKEIKKIFPEERYLVYQKIPTFRVHLKNNVSVGEFHRDRDYNHGRSEINFHLPFTNTNENNSIWIESQEDLEDYKPYILKYGQMLMFDGANLKHGNKINTSDDTRISVDFRIVPFSKYVESDQGSINTHVKFNIGGYFEKI